MLWLNNESEQMLTLVIKHPVYPFSQISPGCPINIRTFEAVSGGCLMNWAGFLLLCRLREGLRGEVRRADGPAGQIGFGMGSPGEGAAPRVPERYRALRFCPTRGGPLFDAGL